LADGQNLDVATARTESYDSPGALPTVRQSSIREDVRRRDCTINTLAIRLNPSHFGELVDLHGGLRDLCDKTIRVLHGLSFVDDPTRVFRAIRFEQRLGFQLHRDTAVLMKEAVSMKICQRLSPSRFSAELHHVLSERKPVKTLARLADFNLLQFIHPRLKWTSGLARLMNAVEQAIAWHAQLSLERLTSPWVVYGMALMDQLPQPAVQETLARLTFPRGQTRSMLWVSQEGPRLLRTLDQTEKPSETFRALCDLPDETLVFLLAKTRSKRGKQTISNQFTTYRRIKSILRGNDLKAMGLEPGPLYNRTLERLLDARLNGEVKTETDERRLVRRLVKGV
jgi:tRNA nucleotidyltransferase (CCA-adding enzyme)